MLHLIFPGILPGCNHKVYTKTRVVIAPHNYIIPEIWKRQLYFQYHNPAGFNSWLKIKNAFPLQEFIDIDKHPIYYIKVFITEDDA